MSRRCVRLGSSCIAMVGAGSIMVCLITPGASAQELQPERLVRDLNAVAALQTMVEVQPTHSATATGTASAGCMAFTEMIEAEYAFAVSEIMRTFYLAEEEMAVYAADEAWIAELSEFERATLLETGATPEAADMVAAAVIEAPEIAVSPPSPEALQDSLIDLRELACELEAEPAAFLAERPPDGIRNVLRGLTAGVMGATAMVLNGSIAVQPGVGQSTIMITMMSAGWGWNRVEEAWRLLFE